MTDADFAEWWAAEEAKRSSALETQEDQYQRVTDSIA
jgi:hypothetical protein